MSKSTSTERRGTVDRQAKSSANMTMSLRNISRMGNSMSAMMAKNKEEDSGQDNSPLPLSDVSNSQWEQAEKTLYSDILEVRRAMDLFLNSHIPEAEQILEPKRNETLYHSLGHSFVLFLRSVMTFQQSDIELAIEALKSTIQKADSFRRKGSSWLGTIGSWVKGLTVQDIKTMSRLHRHAELIYAESYLLKALLCIIHDESFVAFLREGLHVRSSYNTYKALEKFLNHVRQEAMNGQDISEYELDDHFTSGIALGIGLFNIVVSLLPSAIIKVAQIIGFSSNRSYGLETLESTGGWEEFRELPPNDIPPLQEPNEGLRRQFCDMALLAYHIILSKLIPISDLNQELADRVLLYNLTLYPRGVFFLYFSGRQLSALSQLPEAKNQYQTAIDTQKDWKQLQHMCYWELGLINLLQQNWIEADNCYTTLLKESNWSKCVYTYLEAVSIYRIALSKESGSKDQKKLIKKANDTMQNVSSAKQKIAGKSIPLEKFVARKARKFLSQNNRLLFPDLEVLTAFGFFDFQSVELLHINLDRINVEIEKLSREKKHEEMLNYYDDICLCHYLRTMVLRLMITRIKGSDIELWKKLHKESTDFVKDNANRIQLDHYIYYFTQYEESRLYIIEKQFDSAQEIIDALVRSSEKHQFNIGAGPHAKNKYSLENILLFRCHSCTQEIKEISTSDSE